MPPKPSSGASKKTEMKKKEKVIEDKTFGLKNKKGAKTQKFIQQVEKQVKTGGIADRKLQQEPVKSKKELEAEKIAELNKLLRPVTEMPKVGKDVDPKSVVCAFFKQGLCQKGAKCKFSHDLAVERKAEKRNVYFDAREGEDDENADNWDEAKLTEVVEKKHGEKDKLKPKTDIICKYFLEALENSKYGWFWECPNGDTCIYRHALPTGYVLKKDRKRIEEEKKKLQDEISLEDLIEKERSALAGTGTRVTLQSFLAWKRRKLRERRARDAKSDAQKASAYKAGKSTGLSGRELFAFNPELAGGDDEFAEDGDQVMNMQEGGNGDDQDEDPNQPAAFEIDEALFYKDIGLDMDDLDDLDADMEIETSTADPGDVPGPSKPTNHVLNNVTNENVSDLEDSSNNTDDEDDDENEETSDNEINGIARAVDDEEHLQRVIDSVKIRDEHP